MRDCKKIHALLSLHLEGVLSQGEQKLVEKHLAACITARREMEQLGRMRQILKNLPEPQMPPDLHGKIMAGLGMQTAPVRKVSWGRSPLLLAAAMVTVFFFFNRDSGWKESLFRSGEVKVATSRAPSAEKEQARQSSGSRDVASPRADLRLDQSARARTKQTQAEPDLARNKSLGSGKDTVGADSHEPRLSAAYNADTNFEKAEEKKSKPSSSLGIVSKPLETEDLDSLTLENSAAGKTKAAGLSPLPETTNSFAAAPATAAAPLAARKVKSREESEPAIPLPATAPASAKKIAPKVASSWNGNNGPESIERGELVTKVEALNLYWQSFGLAEAVPSVDFTRESVVVLLAGEKPTAGYSIRMGRSEEKEGQLEIHYRIDSPLPDAVAAQMITRPWSMAVIPKPSLPVTFIKDP